MKWTAKYQSWNLVADNPRELYVQLRTGWEYAQLRVRWEWEKLKVTLSFNGIDHNITFKSERDGIIATVNGRIRYYHSSFIILLEHIEKQLREKTKALNYFQNYSVTVPNYIVIRD